MRPAGTQAAAAETASQVLVTVVSVGGAVLTVLAFLSGLTRLT
jgi:hypothetical protein